MKRILFLSILVVLSYNQLLPAQDNVIFMLMDQGARKDEHPSYEQLQQSVELPLELLLRALQSQTDQFARQRGIVWAIAFHEDAGGAPALLNLLARDYDGRLLSVTEEQTLLDDVRLLGFLAKRDRATLEFLKQGSDPESWSRTRKWKSSRNEFVDDLLTSFSIQAIGISGHDETDRFLAQLRERSANYTHRFAGDIVQARFYKHIRERAGEDKLKEYMADPDKDVFRRWAAEQGAEYAKWADEKMRGPVPEQTR